MENVLTLCIHRDILCVNTGGGMEKQAQEIELDEKAQQYMAEQKITQDEFVRRCEIAVEELLKILAEPEE